MRTACHECDYDLTGLGEQGACPECGCRYDLASPYRGQYRVEARRSELWKVILLGSITFGVLACGGLLSLLIENPLGLIATTLFVALLPAFGAFVYWRAEREKR